MVNFKEEIAKLIAPQVADLELAEIQRRIRRWVTMRSLASNSRRC